jgi:hypothetical protein
MHTRITVFLAFTLGSCLPAAASGPQIAVPTLPFAVESSISAAMGREARDYHALVVSRGFQMENQRNRLAADFTATGMEVRMGVASWGLSLQAYGYGKALEPVPSVAPQASLNRVQYRHATLTEWYVNGPAGLEQGFTIDKSPGSTRGEPLTLALETSGNLWAEVNPDRMSLSLKAQDGSTSLRYAGLIASDADGKELNAWLELQGQRLLLRVNDSGAHYPIVIDPVMQLGVLTPSDQQANDGFASTAAIDGDTVVVGAPAASVPHGTAYVFVKPANGWTNMTQTARLVASDSFATYGEYSVAISGDTIVVGAPITVVNGFEAQGAVYVFVKPAGGWSDMKETAKLTGAGFRDFTYLGGAVSISGDTIVAAAAGAFNRNALEVGEALVYVKPKTGWINMTETADLFPQIVPPPVVAAFAGAVATSGDTIVVGANGCCIQGQIYPGLAFVFVKPASGWATTSNYNAKLGGSNEGYSDSFGYAVTVSGNTVAVGMPQMFSFSQGAVYVFVEPPGGWRDMTETAELSVPHVSGGAYLGQSVAISENAVIAGAIFSGFQKGAAYVFVKPNGGWRTTSHSTVTLTSAQGVHFGQAVSLSGRTAIAAYGVKDPINSGAVAVFGASK